MRTTEKAVSLVVPPIAGAAVGYLYLAHILRPAPSGVACPPGPPHDPRCISYQIIVSPPFFLIAGALIGTWIAYALVRLYRDRGERNFSRREGLVAVPVLLGLAVWIIALHPGVEWNWNNGLGWDKVALFFTAAALARLAIGIASIAGPPGGLILAFGMPAVCAGLGYAFITNFQQPPVGHSCPAGAPAAACSYQPLIGESGPWIVLGTLAGVWLAYAVAVAMSGSPRRTLWLEYAVAIPAVTVAIWWALVVGPDQAGQDYVGPYIVAVVLAALLRLLILGWTLRKPASGLLAS